MTKKFADKKLIVFDLDMTLAESKSAIDGEMSDLLGELVMTKKVAVISGGAYSQFTKQLLSNLTIEENKLSQIYLLPTSGARMYRYDDGWESAYEMTIPEKDRERIKGAIQEALRATHFEQPKKLYGEQVEDRGTQITFSALGQDTPLEIKEKWDPSLAKRKVIAEKLQELIPDFSIGIGGTSSIDITMQGIDKSYGVRKLEEHLNIPIKDMLFIGDGLFEGGNDYPVIETGIDWLSVSNPEDTKRIIREMI